MILKFVWNSKRPQIAKATLRKKKKIRDIAFIDFKLYYTAIVIKQYSTDIKKKNRHIGLPWWLNDKESACQCRRPGFDPWSGKI